jgi:hypothetical protein
LNQNSVEKTSFFIVEYCFGPTETRKFKIAFVGKT